MSKLVVIIENGVLVSAVMQKGAEMELYLIEHNDDEASRHDLVPIDEVEDIEQYLEEFTDEQKI